MFVPVSLGQQNERLVLIAGTTAEDADHSQPPKQAVPLQQRGKKRRGRKPGPKPKSALAPAGDVAAAGVVYAAGFDDTLEPDTDFARDGSSPGQYPEVTALPAWACPAGRIRLLARQQARSSAIAAQSCVAEGEGVQSLSTDSGVLQIEGSKEVADGLKASFAGEQAQESIAKTSAVLADFEALHRTVLNWA